MAKKPNKVFKSAKEMIENSPIKGQTADRVTVDDPFVDDTSKECCGATEGCCEPVTTSEQVIGPAHGLPFEPATQKQVDKAKMQLGHLEFVAGNKIQQIREEQTTLGEQVKSINGRIGVHEKTIIGLDNEVAKAREKLHRLAKGLEGDK